MSNRSEKTTWAPGIQSDGWAMSESGFEPGTLAVSETLFAQANGYLGTRGTFEEAVAPGIRSTEGTYLNGVFLREAIHYDESAFGFASHNNKMILVPDAKQVQLSVHGEFLTQGQSSIPRQVRTLDMRTGLLSRVTEWHTPNGESVVIRTRRFVSMNVPGLMVLEYQLESTDFSGDIEMTTGLDAAYGAHKQVGLDPRAGALSIKDCLINEHSARRGGTTFMSHAIRGSDHGVVSAFRLHIDIPGAVTLEQSGDHYIGEKIQITIRPGEPVTLTKYIAYADGPFAERQALSERVHQYLLDAATAGFESLFGTHSTIFNTFWKQAHVQISSDEPVQESLRFGMFHLFQGAGRDGHRSLAAKGLSGPGYDGHYFWDTEIYAVPFFIFTQPDIARALLMYRISHLDAARQRAREMGHRHGALYPWRTIGGEECSSYFPAGTAQYHINSAIAYALVQYVDATGDKSILADGGMEMLVETARIWMGLGHFSKIHQGRFCINEVTGPDEYTAMVDNNLYTNVMAQHHLENTARLIQSLQAENPDGFSSLCNRISLQDSEVGMWERAAREMYLPYDADMGIHEQCDGFFDRPEWDFAATPKANYPLLLNYHPLVIYRHQVLKQPDVVLAQILLPHAFTPGEKSRNLAYYGPRTTHDSTLSACMHAIAHAESGDPEKAYAFFEETYRMDLENRHHNTHYGVHIACMAGSWMGLAYGFGGMRMAEGKLGFAPQLPRGWSDYAFRIQFQGSVINIEVRGDEVTYRHASGPTVSFEHFGNLVSLNDGASLSLPTDM